MAGKGRFVDIRKSQISKNGKGDKDAPQWYLSNGVNYSGKCSNQKCAQWAKKVMCRRGFGDIDPVRDKYSNRIVCPDCGDRFNCDVVYLYNCICSVEYIVWTQKDDGELEKEIYRPKGDDLVILGQENGSSVFTAFSLLEFFCQKQSPLKSQISKNGKGDKDAPQWYLSNGVNYSGKCKNEGCAHYGKKVMCRRGFGDIDALKDKYRKRIVCPECDHKFDCDVVYLSNCKCSVEYIMWTQKDDGELEKETYRPKGDELVILGQENGISIFTEFSLLEFFCQKH